MKDYPQIWIHGKVRKPSRKTRVGYRGHHISQKTETRQTSESLNEHFLNPHLDFSPDIKFYASHPVTFGYTDSAGKSRLYTPDKAAITMSNKVVFIEVKPREIWLLIDWQKKFRYLRAILRSIGSELIVMLDEDIKREPRLKNLQLLNAYARLRVRDNEIFRAVSLLTPEKCHNLMTFAASITSNQAPYALVYFLLFHHIVKCDLEKEINDETLILPA